MIGYPMPLNEEKRVRNLHALDLLNTAFDEELNYLVALVAELCETSFAAINLVDTNQVFIKAKVGLSDTTLPRKDTFCTHTILSHSPLIVTDATSDKRFSCNPFVNGAPYFRFYAGYPLITSAGFCIGTLCVFDTQPRILTDKQKESLQHLSTCVTLVLLSRKKYTAPEHLTQTTSDESLEDYLVQIKLLKQRNLSLVKQLHHRSKNNLQFFSSLLFLKAQQAVSVSDDVFLHKMRNSMRVVSLAHDVLEGTECVDVVNAHDYLHRVIQQYKGNYKELPAITYQINIDRFFISIDRALILGVMLAELLDNSFRHAFQDALHPTISIELHSNTPHYRLIYSDNGSGLPESIHPEQSTSFGMAMLQLFFRQLNAQLLIERNNGTTFNIFWKDTTNYFVL